MRILHTSDWHPGQNFMGKSRQAEHQDLIDWLLTQVEEHVVDAVLVAGHCLFRKPPASGKAENLTVFSSAIAAIEGSRTFGP